MIESGTWQRWLGWRVWQKIICKRPVPPDDHLQEADVTSISDGFFLFISLSIITSCHILSFAHRDVWSAIWAKGDIWGRRPHCQKEAANTYGDFWTTTLPWETRWRLVGLDCRGFLLHDLLSSGWIGVFFLGHFPHPIRHHESFCVMVSITFLFSGIILVFSCQRSQSTSTPVVPKSSSLLPSWSFSFLDQVYFDAEF